LSKIEVLILDDWMRDPILLSSAQDLLEVFDDRFGNSATIIISHVPVSDWHAIFPDPTLADAILDRTIHNAYRLSLLGDPQRKLRGFRSMSHTCCTIISISVFPLLTVRHVPDSVCDITGIRSI
jgi:DNA replication protein DnaC